MKEFECVINKATTIICQSSSPIHPINEWSSSNKIQGVFGVWLYIIIRQMTTFNTSYDRIQLVVSPPLLHFKHVLRCSHRVTVITNHTIDSIITYSSVIKGVTIISTGRTAAYLPCRKRMTFRVRTFPIFRNNAVSYNTKALGLGYVTIRNTWCCFVVVPYIIIPHTCGFSRLMLSGRSSLSTTLGRKNKMACMGFVY